MRGGYAFLTFNNRGRDFITELLKGNDFIRYVDECVLTQPIDIVKEYLRNNISNCNIQIIEKANHSYTNRYEELGKVITNNI